MSAARRMLAPRRAQEDRDRLLFFLAVVAAVVALAAGVVARAVEEGNPAYDDPFERWPPTAAAGTAQVVEDAPARGTRLPRFLRFVAADVQRFWAQEFDRAGIPYAPARVVAFRGQVPTDCGPATAATGPFYCRWTGRSTSSRAYSGISRSSSGHRATSPRRTSSPTRSATTSSPSRA